MANATITTGYVDGNLTFTVNGTVIVTDSKAYARHRSHTRCGPCICPDSWVAIGGTDDADNHYTVWYYCDDKDLDNIVYDEPYDIVCEENEDTVYASAKMLDEEKQMANATIVEFFYHGRLHGTYNTMTGILYVTTCYTSEIVFKHYANKYNAKRGFKRIVREWEGVWRD